MLRPQDLLRPSPAGLYCPIGEFYIDPVRAVDRALVTHGHADHARAGHGRVLATRETLDIMRLRMGEGFTGSEQIATYGQKHDLNGVRVSLDPAGHVLGSAQIRVEYEGLRIVCSGDYKRRADPTCEPFELVPCDVFITEATFALPVFHHSDDRYEIGKLLRSVEQFPGRSHLVGAYSLGKAQRVIRLIREAGYDRTIYIHGALASLCEYYQKQGIDLGDIKPATVDEESVVDFAGAIIVQALIVAFYAAAARALSIPVPVAHLAVMIPLSFIVQMAPVSVNGFGVREATFGVYFTRIGLPLESALALSFSGAVLLMVFSVSGAIVYLLRPSADRATYLEASS